MTEEYVKREMPIPFGTKWYRSENVDLKKIKGEWVFHFSGKVTQYEVGFETYRDLRKLSVSLDYLPAEYWITPTDFPAGMWGRAKSKPKDDILEFLRNWGPLGLYYRDACMFEYEEVIRSEGQDSGFVALLSDSGNGVPLEHYWMNYHTRQLRRAKTRMAIPEPNEVFDQYYEEWSEIHNTLFFVQKCCLEWEEEKSIDALNGHIEPTSLRPYVVPRSDEKGNQKYQLTLAFSNLCDALLGLLAQNVVGKVDMRICENPYCGNLFDAIETGRTTYCSHACSIAGPDNKRLLDPVKKYQRMLQRRLQRCPQKMVSLEESRSINKELLEAKTINALKTIEDKYPVILGKKK